MAHFAELDENNIVKRVIVVSNETLMDENENEDESLGIDFCTGLFPGTKWVQTSYNGNFRKNYAGIGFEYNESLDAFIAPKPFESWILDESTCRWYSPIEQPQLTQEQMDQKCKYVWNEDLYNQTGNGWEIFCL